MFRILIVVSLIATVTACGDDDSAVFLDGGMDVIVPDAGMDGGDTGEVEETAPRVTSTRPRAAEEGVSRDARVEVRFSEPVLRASGSIVASGPDGDIAIGALEWADEGDVASFRPTGRWPGGASITVTVEGFADAAGNVQEDAYNLVFETSDDGAPEVVRTTPMEGALDVPVDALTVSIVFSEPMNPLLGTLELVGEGTLGAPMWSSPTELRVELTGLRPSAMVRIRLTGFEDRSANALLPEPVLINGALDFATAADETPPTLADSNPMHEQLDVQVGRLSTITLTFDEPMDTSIRTVSYAAGTSVGILSGNWSADGLTLSLSARDRVRVDVEHRIDLSNLRDEAGNLLDGTVGLDEGELVFTTSSADAVIPFVVFTDPTEGATGVSTRAPSLRVLFSEAMDTATTTVTLQTASGEVMVEGEWNLAGTELEAPLGGLASNASYQVDLGTFTDLSGNSLDDAHPYLGDGVLDFTTGAPTGETCLDALTIAEASADGGAFEWTLEPGAFTRSEGQPSCGLGADDDGVIEYVKTTGDIASGGTALHIVASSPDALNGIQLEIYRDVCDSEAVGGGDVARETCLEQRPEWDQFLDVPAGTYFIWVASENGAFIGADVRIEEVASIQEGESCGAPYDATSSIHTSLGTDAHRWVVPGYTHESLDFGASADEGSMSCESTQGPDAVVALSKARAGSILDIAIESFPADTGSGVFDRAGTKVAITNTCAPRTPGREELACAGRIRDLENFQLVGDVGDYYLWLAANNTEVAMQRTTVTVREVDPAAGETCATAIPLVPGTTNAVTPSSTATYFKPDCIDVDLEVDPDAGVTWYRYTTTAELSVVTLQGAAEAPLALIDPSGAELACLDEAQGVSVPRRAPIGSEVCVAVPSGAAITGITIEETAWQGVDGGTRTDLGILRPLEEDGDELRITSEAWLELTPTQIHMGVNVTSTTVAGIVSAPRAGGTRAEFIPVDRYSIGNGGASVGEALWSVDESDDPARPERLFRLLDAAGSPATTPWDTGASYLPADIDTLTKIVGESTFLMVSDQETGDPTTLYTVPSDTPQAPTPLGTNANLADVTAIAASTNWIFVGGDGPDGASDNTVFRIPRGDVTAMPERLAPAALVTISSTNGSMVYDATTDILYFRSQRSPYGVYAVFGAGSADPLFAGAVAVIGGSSDYGLALDPAASRLYVFETETSSDGTFTVIE